MNNKMLITPSGILDLVCYLDEIVYLKTDTKQLPRIVTGVNIRCGGRVQFELSQGVDTSWYNDSEISIEKDVLMLIHIDD